MNHLKSIANSLEENDDVDNHSKEPERQPVVLIVDDDRSMRVLLRKILLQDGYVIEEAADGTEALSAFQRLRPDLVLLDAMMPGMDGFAVCTKLRALPDGERLPVLMITALSDKASVDKAFEVGATDYIIKPIHYAVVRHRVCRLLKTKRTELALRQKTAEFQAVFAAIPDFFFRLDPSGTVLNAYTGSTSDFHILPADLIGKRFGEVMPSDIAAKIHEAVTEVHQTNRPHTIEVTLPVKPQEQILEARFWPFLETQVIAMVRNITDRKQMEARMLNTQKLADLGTLAAGAAHEINSPLQVITGISENILFRLDQDQLDLDYLHQKLEIIQRNGWRCAEIVRSLRTYAHVSATQVEPQDLNELVNDALLLIEHQLKSWSNITVLTELAPDLPLLSCNRNQITQILINLLTNARDAMEERGEITIRTRYDQEVRRLTLQVSDTGPGIPESIREKIFDPFFTTKSLGQGTGLGLSIVAGIVRAYGGEIEFESEPDLGTTFTLSFPQGTALESIPTEVEVQGRYDDTVSPTASQNGARGLDLRIMMHS